MQKRWRVEKEYKSRQEKINREDRKYSRGSCKKSTNENIVQTNEKDRKQSTAVLDKNGKLVSEGKMDTIF